MRKARDQYMLTFPKTALLKLLTARTQRVSRGQATEAGKGPPNNN